MKNIVIVVLAVVSGTFLWYALEQKAEAEQAIEDIVACQEAAEASSAETFILQELAEKHKAEAEEHRQAVEVHKKIAEDAMEQVQKLKN